MDNSHSIEESSMAYNYEVHQRITINIYRKYQWMALGNEKQEGKNEKLCLNAYSVEIAIVVNN